MAQAPAPAAAEQAVAPGTQMVKIAAHQSRWDYPKELAVPPTNQIHYVVKGDTLWDLGTKYLGNPFAWPQIWELNKWVKDPHWIYPGDPLLVDGSRGAVAQPGHDLVPQDVADLQPDIKRVFKPTRDEFAYCFQDFLQLPFLAEGGADAYSKRINAVKIVGRQDAGKDMQADGDVVYLNGGTSQGFKAGDRLVAFRVQARKFYHPDDHHHRKTMGDIIQQVGVIRITQAMPTQSIAIIERSLDGVAVGYQAASYQEPANIVASLRTDTGNPVQVKPPTAKVIFIREDKAIAAGGDMVLIDQGLKQGLKVGDSFLATRSERLDPSKGGAKDVTQIYVGQMVVVRVGEQTATCRILRSNKEILVGDSVTR